MSTEAPSTYVPFSIRLTVAERAALERAAAGRSMAGYVREQLFENPHRPKRTRGKFPVADHTALAQALGRLGASEIGASLRELSEAARRGCIDVTPETEAALNEACRTVALIRQDLMVALGSRPPKAGAKAAFRKAAAS